MKNFLAVTALILSLLAVQGSLWRPQAAPRRVMAITGGTAVVAYHGKLEKAVVFQSRTASVSAAGPGRLIIHGITPGTTMLLIQYRDGNRQLYQIVVVPA